MDKMEAFPGALVAQVTSAPFPSTYSSSGVWQCCLAVLWLITVPSTVPHRTLFWLWWNSSACCSWEPHPSLPSPQGSCSSWDVPIWWEKGAEWFGRYMPSPHPSSVICGFVRVFGIERGLAAWSGGRGSMYWGNCNKQPKHKVKQIWQRELSKQMMPIAQCSL